jgi:hypothetical protein
LSAQNPSSVDSAAAFLLLVSLVLSTAMTALAGKATASLGFETVVAVITGGQFHARQLICGHLQYVPNAIAS